MGGCLLIAQANLNVKRRKCYIMFHSLNILQYIFCLTEAQGAVAGEELKQINLLIVSYANKWRAVSCYSIIKHKGEWIEL